MPGTWQAWDVRGRHFPDESVTADGGMPTSALQVIAAAREEHRALEIGVFPRGVVRFDSPWSIYKPELVEWLISWAVHLLKFRGQWTVEIAEAAEGKRPGRTLHSFYVKSHREARAIQRSLTI